MHRSDYVLLGLLMVLLCGFDAISGRPLTLHEARLPETSREMMARGDWLIPTSGGRPWLERPPLPHWIMIATAYATGTHNDHEWSVRIAPGIMAIIIVLLTAQIGTTFLGRSMGIASAVILATMFEFYRYATLAEDDIFLAAVVMATMAVFVHGEFAKQQKLEDRPAAVFGSRPFWVLAFFVLLGLTNLAKGPLVGAAVVIGPAAAYFVLQLDYRGTRRYVWVWGLLIFAVFASGWHLWVQHKFPEYVKNLRYDFNDTEEFDQPIWYYPQVLIGLAMPWSPLAIVGLVLTWRAVWREKTAAMRFLWCWAIVPIFVLSIPHRKHHHYLVPSLAPWAILAAIGARGLAQHMFKGSEFTRRPKFGLLVFGLPGAAALIVLIAMQTIPGPAIVSATLVIVWLLCIWMFYIGLSWERPEWLLAAVVLGVGYVFSWGQKYWPNADIPDTMFLHRVDAEVPRDKLLAVNAAVGPLDFFRLQFYLRPEAMLLHNLSYLRSDQIQSPDIYLVGRANDLAKLALFGNAEQIDQSAKTRAEKSPADRFTLFHLVFTPDLLRYPPPPVSPMQAMMREAGPTCGPG